MTILHFCKGCVSFSVFILRHNTSELYHSLGKYMYDQCPIITPQKQGNEGNRVQRESIMANSGER